MEIICLFVSCQVGPAQVYSAAMNKLIIVEVSWQRQELKTEGSTRFHDAYMCFHDAAELGTCPRTNHSN